MKLTNEQHEEMKNYLSSLIEKLETAERMLKQEQNRVGLFSHNWVIACPTMLWNVGTKAHPKNPNWRIPVVNHGVIASKWTAEGAAEVCAKMKNGRGEHPVKMTGEEYYSKVAESLKSAIKTTKEIFNV